MIFTNNYKGVIDMTEDCGVIARLVRVVFATGIVMVIVSNIVYFSDRTNMKNAALDKDYTVYYNGEQVDPTKMNLDGYAYTVNEDDHEIYLSDPRPIIRHINTVPVVR